MGPGPLGPWVPGPLAPRSLALDPRSLGRTQGPDNDADGRTLIRLPEHHQLVHTSPVIGFVMS
jgi:hypothetical protein